MKRVLIITYYWLPSGGAGVQRWVKFTKYLRDFGWEPVIYAPENPEYPSEDFSFEKDIPADVLVIKKPIWEPYNIYRSLFGEKGQKINAGFISENKKSGWKEKLSIWLRGNFLIPDPRRFWARPSVHFLKNFIQENNIHTVITTGPPHSMHLIGMGLKKHFPELIWIADFRDPWTKIFYFEDLMLTPLSRRIHQRLEKKVLNLANQVIVVSESMQKEFKPFTRQLPVVISNGFDEDDIEKNANERMDEKFTISYIGTLTQNQNPTLFWEVLGEMCSENAQFNDDLIIQLIGKIDYSAIDSIKSHFLDKNLIKSDYLPHSEAIQKQRTSQVLLLLLVKDRDAAKGILTGKFFEYLAAKRPIIALGPTDGDAASILKETSAGKMVDFEDKNEIRGYISELYQSYKNGNSVISTHSINKYTRKELTKSLAEVLNRNCEG